MSEAWGPWIEHDGKGCPCVGRYVEYEAGNPFIKLVIVRDEIERVDGKKAWVNGDYWRNVFVVIRYRIRKPRGLTILEGLLENLPEKVDA